MKILKYILSAAILISAVSCKKFLDVEPRSSVSDEVTIVDGPSAKTALNGVYNALASSDYYGTSFQSLGYLNGDNIKWTGSQGYLNQFILHDVRSDNQALTSVWSAIFQTINRANHVIEKVPTVTGLTDAEKNRIIGEAYFIRALSYFDLARTWGGVQISLTPTTSAGDKNGLIKSTQVQTYAQVLNDLKAAEPLLPETVDRYHATKKTVWALRARYHLYQKEWADAEIYAAKVISDASNYQLLAPFSAFFANNARGTKESVFELYYSATSTNGHRNSWQPGENGGTRQWAPNDAFVALVNDPLIGGNRNVLVAKTGSGLWYGNLYYRSPATDPTYVIRTAELYLIRAEARAQLNNLSTVNGAASDLNAVRARAGLLPTTADTQNAILLAIENERKIEFAEEPHRWFDLVRTGRANEVLGITDANKLLMPIPLNQVSANNPQNPGYN
ncbi:RagB/SusD family nutrient uptake outer membrane protein [Solitalea longa]|uniref:RagB/SusD family nutrient uptake outer membrane protein n=1 Tax=Solitalea longa TaxID=2079460 RepID=A0A2S5A8Q7_9SPHI|nr:RagB/SusD family nutrient uptake outer membrane protein [Solitalea longa]POY38968.1 RagB/SusD family nutrient uptake outer membrane protein [Solitalea longa]